MCIFPSQDQEKTINIHQKSTREQQQERQWKQMQAIRAREQQLQQIQHAGLQEKLQQGSLRRWFGPGFRL